LKVLLLSRYDQLGASSRLRFFQFLPALATEGIGVHVQALLGNDYLHRIYKGRNALFHAAMGVIRRVNVLVASGQYDVLWLEKELFPWLPFWFERGWLTERPVLVDYDDAIFHNYDLHRHRLVRRLLGRKVDHLMRCAAAVTVGNAYLATRAREAGAKRIAVLPTVVDTTRYALRSVGNASKCRIGWIGTPKTARYLENVESALIDVSGKDDVLITLIGSGSVNLRGVPLEMREWSEATEARDISLLDVGIMPIPDEPWERGKCGYKLIQYMASGIPVVASPVGANKELVKHGENGFLANSPTQWSHYLRLLIRDPDLRRHMGLAGRRQVEKQYSVDSVVPKLALLLKSLRS
jgi:glycosyltransferase involved in cell wall biosynthesis